MNLYRRNFSFDFDPTQACEYSSCRSCSGCSYFIILNISQGLICVVYSDPKLHECMISWCCTSGGCPSSVLENPSTISLLIPRNQYSAYHGNLHNLRRDSQHRIHRSLHIFLQLNLWRCLYVRVLSLPVVPEKLLILNNILHGSLCIWPLWPEVTYT